MMFATGRLVMKTGGRELASECGEAFQDDRNCVLIPAPIQSINNNNAWQDSLRVFSMTACKGFMTSFSSCIEASPYCTSGSSTNAADRYFLKKGTCNDNWYAMVGNSRLMLLHSALSLEQKKDAPSSLALLK